MYKGGCVEMGMWDGNVDGDVGWKGIYMMEHGMTLRMRPDDFGESGGGSEIRMMRREREREGESYE